MICPAYYNEIDAYAAQWLRNLMAAKLIAAGDVDTRLIEDVAADDLKEYGQCHFFAGIGGWSAALRLADWPDDRAVWTGSCPCQPLSSAGQRKGHADQRHLWPAFYRLIAERHPATVFGEQVASKDGREWLAGVRADLEGLGYAVGAADLCAAGVGAPHIRQRLWWVADCSKRRSHGVGVAGAAGRQGVEDGGEPGGVVNAYGKGSQPGEQAAETPRHWRTADPAGGGLDNAVGNGRREGRHGYNAGHVGQQLDPAGGGLGDPGAAGLSTRKRQALCGGGRRYEGRAAVQSGGSSDRLGNAQGDGRPGRADDGDQGRRRCSSRPPGAGGFWSPFDLIPCADGKARRVKPGISVLAHGVRNRVGRLRAYGNAINPILGAEFIRAAGEAVMECAP